VFSRSPKGVYSRVQRYPGVSKKKNYKVSPGCFSIAGSAPQKWVYQKDGAEGQSRGQGLKGEKARETPLASSLKVEGDRHPNGKSNSPGRNEGGGVFEASLSFLLDQQIKTFPF